MFYGVHSGLGLRPGHWHVSSAPSDPFKCRQALTVVSSSPVSTNIDWPSPVALTCQRMSSTTNFIPALVFRSLQGSTGYSDSCSSANSVTLLSAARKAGCCCPTHSHTGQRRAWQSALLTVKQYLCTKMHRTYSQFNKYKTRSKDVYNHHQVQRENNAYCEPLITTPTLPGVMTKWTFVIISVVYILPLLHVSLNNTVQGCQLLNFSWKELCTYSFVFHNVDESHHYDSISIPYYMSASCCGSVIFTAETLHMVFVLSSGDEPASGFLLVLCGYLVHRVRVWLRNILRSGAAGL